MDGGLELQPLNQGLGSSSAILLGTTRRGHHKHHSFSDPSVQKKLWIAAGVSIVIAAVIIFAATSTKHQRGAAQHPQTSPAAAAAGTSFPAEPYLAPSSASCQLDDAVSVGPELQLAIPLNYHVALRLTDPAYYQPGDASGRLAAGFAATVNITLDVKQDTPCISLHARNLSFSSITASLTEGATWQQQQQQQPSSDTDVCLCGVAAGCLTTVCARLFKARPAPSEAWVMSLGPYVAPAGSTLLLRATYTATFGPKQGLWRSAPYPSALTAGQQVVALSTEFEMNTARMVLPCLDEPRYKATFVVEVAAPSHMAVLSNTLPASTTNSSDGSVKSVRFLPTPPMSTYLLSIAVGELAAVSAHSDSGQLVRVWTTPGTIEAAAVPLQLSVLALQHYQGFTAINQSRGAAATKWDLLAVPGKTGAVENWALLMMDPERFLLTSPAGAWDLFRCANVICHEIAHQWFGNLVTAATWPDLLVNEGLATLVEYGCLARVLPRQIGAGGAAVLMRGMFGGPAGVMPGVHEGPSDKTLTYDASPLAQPLLGSGVIDFGVPVYSKAASLMAMLSTYAAEAGADDADGGGAADSNGPIQDLMGSTPPNTLQEALRQHLQQHAFSTATASSLLKRIMQLTPQELSSNALAALTGWQSPGSPVIFVQPSEQGLVLTQRRFCAWGLLTDDFMTQLLLTTSATGGSAQLPTPPPPAAAAADSTGNGTQSAPSSSLFCPASQEGQDRAVPWTPVYVALLPRGATVNSYNSSNSTGDDSNTSSSSRQSCGQWVVMRRDQQDVDTTAAAAAAEEDCPDASAALQAHSPGYVLDAAGGWGLFRSHYPQEQRAALRKWVVTYVEQAGAEGAATAANDSTNTSSTSSSDSNSRMDLGLLLTASKVLQDQAALGASVFGEVPAGEVWEVLQAAVNASLAASEQQQEQQQQQLPGHEGAGALEHVVGFGAVLYSLLAPVVPTMELLIGRLAATRTCWLQQQERFAVVISPVAAAALAAWSNGAAAGKSPNTTGLHQTPDSFLGAMTLNKLLTAAALVDAATANKLCEHFNQAAAAAAGAAASSSDGDDAQLLLSHLHPDLQHAVLDIAAAQPPGCQLDWSGDQLLNTLLQWCVGHRNPRIATLAAFALAHFPARGHHSAMPWPHILAVLLGFNNTTTATTTTGAGGQYQPPAAAAGLPPASGVSPVKHAVELAVLLSRAVTLSTRFPQPEVTDSTVSAGSTTSDTNGISNGKEAGPVLGVLMHQWVQLVGSVGVATAWDVLREVAAVEIRTAQQWQLLAVWAAQQLQGQGSVPSSSTTGSTSSTSSEAAMHKVQRKRVQALLSHAWSTVAWLQTNQHSLCSSGS